MASPALQKINDRLVAVMPAYVQALSIPDLGRVRAIIRELFSGRAMPEGTEVIPVKAAGIDCEWIVPTIASTDHRLLYLHGGSYIAGDLDTYRAFVSHVAHSCQCCVLNVGYRLAPENDTSAPREDALTAYRWILQHGPDRVTSPHRVFMAGDSAGGGLAISSIVALRDAGERLPDAAVTLSAAMDLSGMPTLPVEQRRMVDAMTRLFLRDTDPRDPAVSPLYADLRGLPPVLMQVSGAEPALVQNVRFEERARAAGVAARLEIWPEMPHDWQLFTPELPEAEAALAQIGTFVRGFI
jgi:epsilon-lactone hydrolase